MTTRIPEILYWHRFLSKMHEDEKGNVYWDEDTPKRAIDSYNMWIKENESDSKTEKY